jgi:hypothetical protein
MAIIHHSHGLLKYPQARIVLAAVRYLAPMRKWILSCIIALALVSFAMPAAAQTQKITAGNQKLLRSIDDSLQDFGAKMLDELMPTDRLRADSMFTRLLVRAMRVPYSFYYHFDSMDVAPVLYPDDSSFRIITWHLPMNEDNFRQKGVIQMNTADGSIRIFPLFDASDYSEETLRDSVRTPQTWIGAVYYKVIQQTVAQQKVYTLLGYDENGGMTTRKWIETLTFNEQQEPRFGGDYFAVNNDSIFPAGSKRYLIEYKKEGRARLNYDEQDSLIVMDHLVSETNEPDKKYTLIPGGDYEAFKWNKGRWQFIDKLYMEQRGDGNEPTPMTILDKDGNADEEALMKQTEKNIKGAEEQE